MSECNYGRYIFDEAESKYTEIIYWDEHKDKPIYEKSEILYDTVKKVMKKVCNNVLEDLEPEIEFPSPHNEVKADVKINLNLTYKIVGNYPGNTAVKIKPDVESKIYWDGNYGV